MKGHRFSWAYRDSLASGRLYQARCSCGWHSAEERRRFRSDARDAYDDHIEAVKAEAPKAAR